MYPHPIQLRGPWDYEPLMCTEQRADGAIVEVSKKPPPSGRMRLPCRWSEGGLANFGGTVRFRRRFQRPRTLDDYERLWLVCEGADYHSSWQLNGHKLGVHQGAFDPFAFDITRVVEPRNELVVEVDCPSLIEPEPVIQSTLRGALGPAGGLWGVVALEVRRETFLRDLRIWSAVEGRDRRLHVAGQIVSELNQSCELYILVAGAVVYYGQARGSSRGTPFQIACAVPNVPTWPDETRPIEVKVELIDAASRLDTQILPFGFRQLGAADPLTAEHIVDLPEPVRDNTPLSAADLLGREMWLRLPLRGALPEDETLRSDALRQCRVIVQELMHHPCIAGWVVPRSPDPREARFRETLREGIRLVDPVRVCL